MIKTKLMILIHRDRTKSHDTLVTQSKVIVATTLAVSLAACSGMPSKTASTTTAKPNILLKQPYQVLDPNTVSVSEQPSIASKRWQDFYSDDKLKSLIALGLANNKDMKNAILAIQKSRAQYQITNVKNIPTLSSDASATASGDFDGHDSKNYHVGLGMANYEFDFWGKVSSMKEQALDNYLATAAAKDAAQISLISNIAQSYANLSYGLAQLQLAEATVKSREQSLFITKKRFEAGIDAKSPSLQAEASLESAKIAVYNAQNNILKARNALQFLIGAPIPAELMPEPAVSHITNETIFNTGLPSELLYYRPDILQAEYQLKSAGANINVARSAFFPSISLSGRVGFASTSLDDLFKSGSGSWSFGPAISLPIFDAGQRKANYEVSKIEQEQALSHYEKTIQTAFKEVSDVLAKRANLENEMTSQQKLQNNLNQTYTIAAARFKAGLSNYLDVLDAERSQFANQQSMLNLQLAKITSQIELYQALGGGASLSLPQSQSQKQKQQVVVTDTLSIAIPAELTQAQPTQTTNSPVEAKPETQPKPTVQPSGSLADDQTENTAQSIAQ